MCAGVSPHFPGCSCIIFKRKGGSILAYSVRSEWEIQSFGFFFFFNLNIQRCHYTVNLPSVHIVYFKFLGLAFKMLLCPSLRHSTSISFIYFTCLLKGMELFRVTWTVLLISPYLCLSCSLQLRFPFHVVTLPHFHDSHYQWKSHLDFQLPCSSIWFLKLFLWFLHIIIISLYAYPQFPLLISFQNCVLFYVIFWLFGYCSHFLPEKKACDLVIFVPHLRLSIEHCA